MAKTTSDLIVERLIDWGVDTIFGLPGDGVDGFFEALRTHQDKLRFVQVRHEEAAAFAAVGYAKYTGRIGVCVATSGPGGIHLLNGLYDAKCDLQPVLAITGHTFHDLIGMSYQQDVDLDKVFMDVAVFNERLMGPAHAENLVDMAIRAAYGRRGVAHITIPKDMQEWKVSDEQRSKANVPMHSADLAAPLAFRPATALLEQAAEIINKGSKVTVFVGRGALHAREEVEQLAELVGGPVVKALLGKGVLPDQSPYTTGGIGLLGTAPSVDAMNECDTLIMIGTSFPYMEFLPKPGQAKCVQIELDPTRVGLRHPVDVALTGDSKTILQALLPMLKKKDGKFLKKAQERMKDWNELLTDRGTRTDMPMKPQVVTHTLSRLLNDDAIVSADSGTIATWTARYVQMRGNMQFSLSGMLATMANGLPYSIGAAAAYPGRQVVCVVGDGGLSMLMAEIATLVKYNLNVTVIVVKNNVLGQIKWEQIVLEGNPEFGVELHPIDFAKVAEACGARGFTLERAEDAEAVLREALAHPGPSVVQAVVDPNEPPMPGKVTTDQALHFAKALLRGQKDASKIIKTLAEDQIREVV
ncbi:thiamine pyrophosphate-dependent enzyme [Occallatibacter riparius]|uniref:Thiamine pyrophosphate-dependent enzyme n=1 Tax=Occallatibacter riparius TaxID=1002689 RepID=A0A9J7BSS2_9BACT|nr:thiamine pyrophosphate-dependent enzyme [Occallatibacter riparius]UWZ85924.1 thiamine pyrophosphate-dependent enzyme [Occallatibacter riparius]